VLGNEYWNTTGYKKEFEDLFYFEKITPFLSQDSMIIEYGCGYGRLLNMIKSQGYQNLLGFDLSSKMDPLVLLGDHQDYRSKF